MSERNLALLMNLAPGDVTVMTPLVRDIAATYGDRYSIEVRTNHSGIFGHNPYISKEYNPLAEVVEMQGHPPGIERAGRGEKIHFSRFLYDLFEQRTGIKVPMLKSKSDLHLSEYEKSVSPIAGRYWLMFGGGKSDMTIKHWASSNYQTVVDTLLREGIHVVQSGGTTKGKTRHIHPPLNNVLNIVGWGGLREMIWQIYHADGVICPITAAMHMSSAFDKPCVVIAGGREEPWWEAYNNDWGAFGPDAEPVKVEHKFLHTLGKLECCATKGCWRKLVTQADGDDKRICYKPVHKRREPSTALCMDMITPDTVVEAVLGYYRDGIIPPVDKAQDKPKLLVDFVTKVKPKIVDPLSVQALLNQSDSAFGSMDHPAVGGKFTICTTLFGDYFPLHRRCLKSITDTIPYDRMELRVSLNNVCKQTRSFLDTIPVAKVYDSATNLKKYPAMRQMFWDAEMPLSTNYVVYLDDDSYFVRPDWYEVLAKCIADNHLSNVGMYGELLSHALPDEGCKAWFERGAWHNRIPMRTKTGAKSQDGCWLHYCRGSFWCISAKAIKACDIPDSRLIQAGSQVIGEQLWQNGYNIKNLNSGGSLAAIPVPLSRGYREKTPWSKYVPSHQTDVQRA